MENTIYLRVLFDMFAEKDIIQFEKQQQHRGMCDKVDGFWNSN